jgi:hypothetical protein
MTNNHRNLHGDPDSKLRKDLLALEQETAGDDLFRLAQARNNALQQRRRTQRTMLWPVVGTTFASLFLIGLLVLPNQHKAIQSPDHSPQQNAMPITDTGADDELLEFSEENLDLYEDLDFYDWLADIES